jgi:hypothetical protein
VIFKYVVEAEVVERYAAIVAKVFEAYVNDG